MKFSAVLPFASLLILIGGAATARAQVLVPPRGDLRVPPRPLIRDRAGVVVTSETVNATIRDGVAETEVTYLLTNPTSVNAEADLLLPIPPGADVQSFAMYDGETKMDARLLDKNEATTTYEEIVRRRRDPALLTFAGRGLLRARVFPIEPGKPRRITLKLTTILPRDTRDNARKYAWTLAGPHLPGTVVPQQVSVRVTVVSSQTGGVGSVYSPTHAVTLRRDSGEKVVASWDGTGADGAVLAENPEFDLYVAPGGSGKNAPVALSVLTYKGPSQVASASNSVAGESGYFLVVASPAVAENAASAAPRRVVFVLDRSGSMDGVKIAQAKSAMHFAVNKLRPQDTFNLLTFSDKVENFAPEPVPANADNVKKANAWVDDIVADGGTNIDGALRDGLKQFTEKSSGNTLLFFTDGLPTVGTRSQTDIVKNAVAAGGNRARTFVFGVGYDVDVPFLDSVAKALRGDADYVRPDENIETKTSQFVRKTRAPVLENLRLTVDGAKVNDVYPRPQEIPDLFAGGQIVLVGRYNGAASDVKITLSGDIAGRPQTFTLPARFPNQATEAAFLPRLWASRKIGTLMDSVRLGEKEATKAETIEQIKNLSREFGILTPYTALFVPEPGMPVALDGVRASQRISRRSGGFGGGAVSAAGAAASANTNTTGYPDATYAAPTVRAGAKAVDLSQSSRAQRSKNQVGNLDSYALKSEQGQREDAALVRHIQTVGTRTFYQTGAVWTDATFDAKKQTQIIKVKLYSPAYFALTRRNADFARWASVGEQVVVAANKTQAVQFGTEGRDTLTDAELTALAGK